MTALVSVNGLSVTLGGRDVVRDVSLSVAAGEIVLIVGHNGSGKSTLLKAIAGLLPASRGGIAFSDHQHRCAMVLQERNVFLDRTVEENIAIEVLGRFRPAPSSKRELRKRIISLCPELEPYLSQRCSKLSGGMRQLTALCRISLSEGPIMLSDEPSVGLGSDVAARALQALSQAARQPGRCGLIVEHNYRAVLPAVARLCIMKDGSIVYDGPTDIVERTQEFGDLYF